MDRETARSRACNLLKSYIDSDVRSPKFHAADKGKGSPRAVFAEVLGRTEKSICNYFHKLPPKQTFYPILGLLFGTSPDEIKKRNELELLWQTAMGIQAPPELWDGNFDGLSSEEIALLWVASQSATPADLSWLRRLYGAQVTPIRERLAKQGVLSEEEGWKVPSPLAKALHGHVLDTLGDEILAERPQLLKQLPLLDTRESEGAVRARRHEIVRGLIEALASLGVAPTALVPRLLSMLETARQERDESFLAGNLLNLLTLARGTLSDLDLSKLVIRHAFLSDTTMQSASLAGSRLDECVLADTFGSIWQVGFRQGNHQVLASSVTGQVRVFGVDTATTAQIFGLKEKECHRGWSFGFAEGHGLVASAGGDGEILVWNSKGHLEARYRGHKSRVRGVAFLPDKSIVSCSEDRKVYRWQRTFAGARPSLLYEHGDRAATLALSPDSTLLVTGAGDGEIILYKLNGTEIIRRKVHDGEVRCVRFSSDGSRIASIGDDDKVVIWKSADFSKVSEFAVPTKAKAVCFLGESNVDLLVGDDMGHITPWRAPYIDREPGWASHRNVIRSLDTSRSGELVASGGDDQTLQVWRMGPEAEQQPVLERSYSGTLSQVRALVFTTESELASAHDDGNIHFWSVKTGEPITGHTIKAHKGRIWSLALLSGGELLVSAGEDGLIKAWRGPPDLIEQCWTGHQYRVFAVACRDLPSLLVASGGSDKTIRFWQLGQEEAIQVIASDEGHNRRVRDVSFSPDGTLLASVGEDGQIILWHAPEGKWQMHSSRTEMRANGTEPAPVTSVRFTPDGGSLVYVTDEGDLIHWQWANETARRAGVCKRPLISVTIAPSGTTALVGSEEGNVYSIDLVSMAASPAIEAHRDWVEQILHSPDGSYFATASDDQQVKIFDSETMRLHVGPLEATLPYKGLCIDHVSGIDEAAHAKLIALGAYETNPISRVKEQR